MTFEVYLISGDSALEQEFEAALGEQRAALRRLASPAELLDIAASDPMPRAVVVVEDGRALDPVWWRSVRARAPQAQLVVVCRKCSDEIWRRWILLGATSVLRAPLDGLDLETEYAGEPLIGSLFRRHPGLAPNGNTMFRYTFPSDPAHHAALFNKPGHELIQSYIYAIVTDGDLMEGVASEAASLAGHLQLGRIVYLYDDNHISIDGSTDLAFTEDRALRFEAYGWHVQKVDDGNDVEMIDNAIKNAKADPRPSIICVRTMIGYGAPKRQGTSKAHGEPLGDEELNAAKENLGWPLKPRFYIPDDVLAFYRKAVDQGREREFDWKLGFHLAEDLGHVERLHLADDLVEHGARDRARLRGQEHAIAQHRQGRDGADAERRGQRGLRLGVDLAEHHVGVAAGRPLEHRRERPAWTAPRGPEVEQDDALGHDVLEVASGHFHGRHASLHAGESRSRPEGFAVYTPGRVGHAFDDLDTTNELALLEAARAGDPRALEDLLAQHQGRIYRFGLKMCGDPADAQDVTQETLLASNLLEYTLSYAPKGSTTFTQLAKGTTAVTNGTLGTFDPTLLKNGIYDIRLHATDTNGNRAWIDTTWRVTGDMKVGNFTVTFTDLQVPVSGLPVTVNRRYDSRDKTQGDFGIGWKVDIQNTKLDENRTPGDGWPQAKDSFWGSYCITGDTEHYVSINLPDGRTEEFHISRRCKLPDHEEAGAEQREKMVGNI